MDPLHEIFSVASTTTTMGNNATTQNADNNLQNLFSSTNDNSSNANANNVMTKDKILALFNTPQTAPVSGMNMTPVNMQVPTGM